jgi:hypothetical protein
MPEKMAAYTGRGWLIGEATADEHAQTGERGGEPG